MSGGFGIPFFEEHHHEEDETPRHHHHGTKRRANSLSSNDDSHIGHESRPLEPPVLVYHESARSIVFRDHLRRAEKHHAELKRQEKDEEQHAPGTDDQSSQQPNQQQQQPTMVIAGFQPKIIPLPPLELTAKDVFQPLLDQDVMDQSTQEADMSEKEQHIVRLLETQHAAVKTIQNREWATFLDRFRHAKPKRSSKYPNVHDDMMTVEEDGGSVQWNSFVTSTSLLPPWGKKMRCYGSTKEYTTSVIFPLPEFDSIEEEANAQERTQTWSWPAGYAAKTEFNIDSRSGKLINGREEALVSFSGLRQNNIDYITKTDYEILGRLIPGGLQTVPYNEVFLRVGGGGNAHVALDTGVGLPLALFTREATYGSLMRLLRTRARVLHVLEEAYAAEDDLPLLYITPRDGVKVLTKSLQQQLLQTMAQSLNPFQNPTIAYKTTMEATQGAVGDLNSNPFLQQKMEELLDLDADAIRQTLTPEERARLAGGFGATDDSVATLLMEALEKDGFKSNDGDASDSTTGTPSSGHHLQDTVNEALCSAVRSGDYHTSRQLLILYTLVASHHHDAAAQAKGKKKADEDVPRTRALIRHDSDDSVMFCDGIVKSGGSKEETLRIDEHKLVPPPPPPPLDTDRLRSATNSDGLLAVLGAAQVLKAMQDGGAKKRVYESVAAISEWIEHGENSVAFRLASWRDQRAAQDDLKIAMEDSSNFMAFVSNKAISNRKAFAQKLQAAVQQSSTVLDNSYEFLRAINTMVSEMHSPCLRLELLQYVLGLDNRYSVAHLARSVELAATCLAMSAQSLALEAAGADPVDGTTA